MFDSQFHAKASAKLNQILTDPNDQRSLLGKMVPSRKAATKASLGAEVDSLRPGNYFGQEGLLQKDEITPFSSVANEYTELLMIDSSTFKEVFLAHFEKDLYDKALYLVNLDLFSNWSPHLVRQLALSIKEVYYGNSECLYRQGMSLSHVFILKSGSVKLSTGRSSKPAQELLDQIIPPKDYLSDILAETSLSTKKRPFQSFRRSLVSGTSRMKLLSASPSVTNNTIHLRSRALQRHTMSAPPLRKQKTSHKPSKVTNPIVSFRLQEPRPHSTSQVCCLGPGDMLNHIEMLCNVKHSLFNAFSLSDSVVYKIDTLTFMQLLEKKPLHSLHYLIKQTIERIQVWKGRNPSILTFTPLLEVLQQAEKHIASTHHSRKQQVLPVQHSSEKLAFLTVKHLGKYFSKGFQVGTETPQVQIDDATSSLSESVIRKQFFIRQLTSKSLDASYVHVSKACTSFDAPLPKSCNHFTCSSDSSTDSDDISSHNPSSVPLQIRSSTDSRNVPITTLPNDKLTISCTTTQSSSSTTQSSCNNINNLSQNDSTTTQSSYNNIHHLSQNDSVVCDEKKHSKFGSTAPISDKDHPRFGYVFSYVVTHLLNFQSPMSTIISYSAFSCF